jgi:phosphoribosylanthranilate isomerase
MARNINMRIKICGLFREQDIDYVNEALPNYAGFVFAESKRQVSAVFAERLRSQLADSIVPVGVFVNAKIEDIAALYCGGVISIAQLHGTEDEEYISRLKGVVCSNKEAVPIIKTVILKKPEKLTLLTSNADYYLVDSGAGSGKSFNWELLKAQKIEKPWFLAGGVNIDNIEQAIAFNPFAVDVSSGVETDGIKDRKKILQLTAIAKKGNIE